MIAGIYVMNFENMPELGAHYAYCVIPGFTVLVAIGLLGFLYEQGWFD